MLNFRYLKKSFLLFFFTLSLSFAVYGDTVRILDNPEDALSLRYELIKKAQKQILISYFIFAEDRTSIELLSLLREKARQGVEVKLIVDDLFNDIPKYVGTHLIKSGVEIKNFNKFNLFRLIKTIKYRMHDKMLVVDGSEIILGGRNIEDTYYNRATKNYDDRDVYIAGTTAEIASDYYLKLWKAKHLTNFKLARKKYIKKDRQRRHLRKQKQAVQILDDAFVNYNQTKSSFSMNKWLASALEVESIELAHDEINSVKNSEVGTTKKLYELLKNAKHTIIIDSPYLILTDELKGIFQELLDRNISIRILTNSLRATDGMMPAAGYLNQREEIANMGIDLYEYNSDDSFHSKSFVIDDEIAIIGSFNLDPRSQNLNTETLAIIQDERVAHRLTESMNLTLNSAYQIGEDGSPIGHAEELPGVGLRKRIITRMLQILVAPWAKGLL